MKFEPYQLFLDVNGLSYVLVKELRGGFFWIALRVSYVPQLHMFSLANLRRMQFLGRVNLAP